MSSEHAAAITPSLPSEALAVVEYDIFRACNEARRERASVMLIAVSKTFEADAIKPVIAAGQRVFGENRVQEAKAKWPGLIAAHPGIALHLIGPLQSNKAKEAVALFDAIHSVDRPSICEALAKEIERQQRTPQLFAQLNTGEEPAGGRRAGAAFRADRKNRRAQRFEESVDGHERRLCHCDPVRRHACPGRLGDFRGEVTRP
jgi:uncharacterized pyridoxal phosphate-containing UPF0001 family protein